MNDLIEKVLEILRRNVQADRKIKRIVYEDPVYIADVDKPCIVVYPIQTVPSTITNQSDSDTLTIEIGLILDSRQYFGARCTNPEDSMNVQVAKEAIKIMEERDENYKLKENTILGTIRKDLYYIDQLSIRNEVAGVTYRSIPEGEFPQYVAIVRVVFYTDTYCRA